MKLYTGLSTPIQGKVYDPDFTLHPAPVVTIATTPSVASEEYYLADADGYVLTDADGYMLTIKG